MSLPLEGVRVLDLSRMWAVPGAGMYLADQGADVIKVESIRGDDARRVFTLPPIAGEARSFWVLNRNKRGIVVDLRQEQGRQILRRLAGKADVLLHNFRPGVDESLGLTYESLRPGNPGLVYVAFSPYGQKGPLRNARGYDLLVQAVSGISGRRELPGGKPRGSGMWTIDTSSSIMIAYAVMLALFQRTATGRGQKIESSLLHTAMALQSVEMVRVREIEESWQADDLTAQAAFGAYRCADGRHVQLAVINDAEWANLCRALAKEQLIEAPEFAGYQQRLDNSDALTALLEEAFAQKSSGQWTALLLEHDVPAMVVTPPQEAMESEQARANELFAEWEQPGVGRAVGVNVPFRLSESGPYHFRPAPSPGQHTDEVLAELGLAPDEIAALREQGAVR